MGSGNVFIFAIILLILLAFDTRAFRIPTGPYHFLILCWQWPQSYCNTGDRVCERPVRNKFTIHSLAPAYKVVQPPYTQFWFVPPYSEENGCTTAEPEDPYNITSDLFATISDDMQTYMPDVAHRSFSGRSEDFWRTQFERHGMCFDIPNHPLFYFLVTLHLARKYDYILDIFNQAQIVPGNEHVLRDIIVAINGNLRKVTTIRCNEDSDGRKQLNEVWLCFNKELKMISCPYQTFNCPDKQQSIWFHSAYPAN
ncbi:ribonuclease 1-like [Tripterygium wilfordii]|uniref:ribonuclease 1-like n=1 Tax=Tripterygium wilfordii TaxID=458696 RepID=UPI0018F80918|nr:ribonuclease 1-like [Tripterygium wilfordii]